MSIPVLLIILSYTIFAGYLIITSTGDSFNDSTEASNLLYNAKLMFSRIGNSSFLFIAIALILFNLVGSFLAISHHIFMIIDIILLPLSVMVAAVMSNAYEASLYTMTQASAFPVMNFVMLHLPVIIVVSSILSAIAAYALVKQ